ncbi:hypothetical protein HW49_00480 [Porphyromonadaceae bacterium COT-184 OH4590]|nr:hypothetical protein HW49_00480 [Porphyromonadaceae bacterium COT-184 OH4590]
MTKDFDLQSPQWLEILFEGKNKRYGAYQLRDESSNRHIKALIIVIILGFAAIFLPEVIENMIVKQQAVTQDEAFKQTDFDTKIEDKKPEDQQAIEIPTTPPPVLAKTIMVTEAKIVEDTQIQEQNLAQANDALKNLDAEIAAKTNLEGVTDGTGVNVDDYQEVVQEPVEKEDRQVYTWVQVKPSFPGGEDARLKWLQDNLVYPSQAAEANIQGLVQVGFVVEKDGSITDVKIVKGVHSLLDREAIRLVKSMPRWIPGKQNGNTVRAYFTQPIRFILK